MSDLAKPSVHLFARYPTPWLAKTRLIPRVGAQGAADIHRRLVERTVATLAAAVWPLVIRTTGAPLSQFKAWLGDVTLLDQGTGDLGERLARVPAPAILLGADIPGLTHEHLVAAAAALADRTVAIGPATDGGYYLLAFREPVPFLFDAMPWGTDAVFAETVRRLDALGVSHAVLAPLDDCDRPEDLDRWPELLA